MANCATCKHAIFDCEEYYGTTAKHWFVSDCKIDAVPNEDGECEDYEEGER